MSETLSIADAVKAAKKAGITIDGLPKGGKKLPAKLGPIVDEYHDLRELRLQLDKVVNAMKAEETRMTNHIIDNLDKTQEGGAVGRRFKAIVRTETVPQVEDWTEFYAYIKKKDAFDLLNRAINKAAFKARMEEGIKVPGTGTFNAVKLSVTKL